MFGYNSYGSRGSSSLLPGLDSLVSFGSTTGVLIFVAFVAAIVLTVLGYRKFISKKVGTRFRIRDTSTWGPFLRFDTLLIDKILQALYLFNTLFIAFCGVAVILGSFAFGVGGFLTSLIGQVILVAILELLNRIAYEAVMLGVITARNTTAIRNMLSGDEKADANGIASLSPDSAPISPIAPVAPAAPFTPLAPTAPVASAPSEAPVAPATAAAPESPVAPETPAAAPETREDPATVLAQDISAGEAEKPEESFGGHFCPFCGAEAAPDSHFCGSCGKPLD